MGVKFNTQESSTVLAENILKNLNITPENLEEIARLRLARPDASLKELGEALDSPVGKSGVNHRLRKLSAIAEELREKDAGSGIGGSLSQGK